MVGGSGLSPGRSCRAPATHSDSQPATQPSKEPTVLSTTLSTRFSFFWPPFGSLLHVHASKCASPQTHLPISPLYIECASRFRITKLFFSLILSGFSSSGIRILRPLTQPDCISVNPPSSCSRRAARFFPSSPPLLQTGPPPTSRYRGFEDIDSTLSSNQIRVSKYPEINTILPSLMLTP